MSLIKLDYKSQYIIIGIKYNKNLSIINYFFYILKTLRGKGFGDRISKSELIFKNAQ